MSQRFHLVTAFGASMLLLVACSSSDTTSSNGGIYGSSGAGGSTGGSGGSTAGSGGSTAGGGGEGGSGGSAGAAGGSGGSGGSSAGGSAGSTGGPTTVEVGASGFTFSPSEVTIAKGETVHFVWKSSGHNVVSGTNGTADNTFCSPSDSNCASAPLSSEGTTYDHTFNDAGTFPYFCSAHFSLGMTGTVVVQ